MERTKLHVINEGEKYQPLQFGYTMQDDERVLNLNSDKAFVNPVGLVSLDGFIHKEPDDRLSNVRIVSPEGYIASSDASTLAVGKDFYLGINIEPIDYDQHQYKVTADIPDTAFNFDFTVTQIQRDIDTGGPLELEPDVLVSLTEEQLKQLRWSIQEIQVESEVTINS